MNQRDALRWAAQDLGKVAKTEAEGYATSSREIPAEWTDRDAQRIAQGFRTLAARLEYTATGERPAKPESVDPDQIPLFEED